MTAPPQVEPRAAANSESRKAETPQETDGTLKAVQRRMNIRAHCTASIGRQTHQEHQINNIAGTPRKGEGFVPFSMRFHTIPVNFELIFPTGK